MRKINKLSSDDSDSGNNKCDLGYGDAYGWALNSLRLAGVWSQVVSFVLVRWK